MALEFYTFDQNDNQIPVSELVEYTDYTVTVEADSVRFLGSELQKDKRKHNSWSFKTPFAVGRSASLCWTVGKQEYKEELIIFGKTLCHCNGTHQLQPLTI